MFEDKYLSVFFKSNCGYCFHLLSFKYFSQHAGFALGYSPLLPGAYSVKDAVRATACELKHLQDFKCYFRI